jgi:thioredoxin reductase
VTKNRNGTTILGYDVVVVGGGAAGLNGALVLARARRSVLVVDAGEPRNAPSAHAQGFLTRDGVPPGELLALGRAEVLGYGGEIVTGHACTAAPAPGGGHTVTLADGSAVHGRRLLVTTGVTDTLPEVAGVRERWGRDVVHCPYCHGWEVRDQAIGVLATGPMAVHQALLFRQWSADVVLFTHTGPAPSEEDRERLAARGVTVVPGEVAELVVTDDRLRGVRLTSGDAVARDALAVGPVVVARDELLVSLGLPAVEHPMGVGSYVPSEAAGRTAVPGVWVAGNVADPLVGLVAAAAGGSAAAMGINADLVDEDTRHAVEQSVAVA